MSGVWDKAIDNRSKREIRLAEKAEEVLRENPFLTQVMAKTYARRVLVAEARGEEPPAPPPPPPRLRARHTAPQTDHVSAIEPDATLLFPPEAVKQSKRDKLPPDVIEGAPYQPPLFDYKAANAHPLAELAARELCRRRLLPFIQRFRPRYKAGWVHADICRRVERFIERVERGEDPRLLLMMPPRSGKSEILSRNAPAWIIGKHPEWELIAASHTASLTMTFSRYIRDVLRDPAFSAVFPDAVLDPSSQSVENWNTTQGGGYLASGQGGAITGRGAHVFLVDDIVKDNEAAQSLSQRESTWSWWNSTAYTRLAPGGGVIALMTNWHADDWAGRIQETMRLGGEVYEVVKYPAINEYGDEYLLLDDSIEQIATGEPIPAGAQMTRPMGTALHPERYSTKSMLQKKQNLVMSGQKTVWDALYQQNPVPDEGTYFKKEMFRSYSTPPRRADMYIYQAWDFAISTGDQNDYTVGITIGVDHNDAVYVLDMKRFRSSDGILIAETVRDYSLEWGATMIGVEDGQIWRSIETQFLKACEEKRSYPSYEALKPLTDKMVRADPLKGRMQAGKIYFPSAAHWLKVLETEMLHFPNAKHDDCCFVAGTKVAMADGSMKRIEDVQVGDKVHTPVGPKTVLVSTRTMKDAVVFDLDGRLVGTGNHPIWTENSGWVPMQALMNSDILQCIESQEEEESSCREFTLQQPPTSTVSNLMGRCTAVTRTLLEHIFGTTTQDPEPSCTGSSGRTRTGRFLRGITYTTRTGITSTTTSTTSSAYLLRNIMESISRTTPNVVDPTRRSNILLRFAQRLLHGTSLMKVWRGMLSTVRGVGSTESKQISYVKSAAQASNHSSQTPSFAGNLVRTRHGTRPIQVMRRPRELEGRRPVFNLTVVDAHCFYANGILVHNCDALAWAVRLTLARTPPREKARPKEKSWKDKLRKMTHTGSHMAA